MERVRDIEELIREMEALPEGRLKELPGDFLASGGVSTLTLGEDLVEASLREDRLNIISRNRKTGAHTTLEFRAWGWGFVPYSLTLSEPYCASVEDTTGEILTSAVFSPPTLIALRKTIEVGQRSINISLEKKNGVWRQNLVFSFRFEEHGVSHEEKKERKWRSANIADLPNLFDETPQELVLKFFLPPL